MSWKNGVWTPDGKGNPNKKGDNSTPTTDPTKLVGALGGLGGTSTFGAVDLSNSTFNVLGLGIPSRFLPGGKTVLTADELELALHQTATSSPQIWAGVQYAMYLTHNYPKNFMPDIGAFSSPDIAALKKLAGDMTVLAGDTPTAMPLTTFLQTQENNAITLGGNSVRNQIAKVTIPNTKDLNAVLKSAFTTALGRQPTDAEMNKFASSYQSSVLGNAQANASTTATAKSVVNPNTALGADTGGEPHNTVPAPTIAQNLASANTVPTVSVVGQQDVPNANTAATDFALKSDPTGAAENGLNDAMNGWFATLAKGGGQ